MPAPKVAKAEMGRNIWMARNGSHEPGSSRPQKAGSKRCARFVQLCTGRPHAAKAAGPAALMAFERAARVNGARWSARDGA